MAMRWRPALHARSTPDGLLGTLLLACLFAIPARAELQNHPLERLQTEVRLERHTLDDVDLDVGTHVGRFRARWPMGNHSLELFVPWSRIGFEATEEPSDSSTELGNVAIGFGLHVSPRPLRFLFLLGLPTTSESDRFQRDAAGWYAGVSKMVPELESYMPGVDGFFRAEMQWSDPWGEGARSNGRMGFVLRRSEARNASDYEADVVGGAGIELQNLDFVMAMGAEFRLTGDDMFGDSVHSDILLSIGRDSDRWRSELELRVPLDDYRRDIVPIGLGLRVTYHDIQP